MRHAVQTAGIKDAAIAAPTHRKVLIATRRAWLGVMVLVALCSCGGGGTSGSSSPEGTAQAFYRALLANDPKAACELTADAKTRKPSIQDTSPQGLLAQCEAYVALGIASSSKLATLMGKDVQIHAATTNGDSATISDSDVLVDGTPIPDKNTAPLKLMRIDGTWYVTDFG